MTEQPSSLDGMSPQDGSRGPYGTALVLGGGGSAGNAWLIGVIAGLAEGGRPVQDADLVVGTSAGSTAAVQILGADPLDLLSGILAATPPPADRTAVGRPPVRPVTSQLEVTSAIIASADDPAGMRRRLGAWALEMAAAAGESAQASWRARVASRLPVEVWPRRRLLIAAVDAESGEPVVFDRDSGVPLVDAVAASCSSGSAYRIGSRQYIDGGYRSNADNADLAAGYERVLVLSPFSGRSRTPVGWGLHLETQVQRLRMSGAAVETVFPDGPSRTAMGDNVMDPSTRSPAARSGYEQGRALAEPLAHFWVS